MRLLLAGLSVLLGLTAPVTSLSRATSTSFQLVPPGDIVMPVTIDGQGPFRLLIDTGTSRSAISRRLAARLGARVVGQTTVMTPSGQASRSMAVLKHVALGVEHSASVVGLMLEDGDLASSPAVDGLIGQDILARWIYTIDYGSEQLIWRSADAADPPGTRLDLAVTGGRMLASLPQRGGAGSIAPLQFIPDSGADGLVLFAHAGRAMPSMTPLHAGSLRTLAGARPARQVLIGDLDVGEIRLRNQVAALVESPGPGAPLGDGLLPLHLFARVTINGPGGYLIVQP